MKTLDFLKLLTEDIHSVVIATLGTTGRPETRVIDMMLYDTQGLYFLTARGKSFYAQLIAQGFVSLSGTDGKRAVRVDGKVRSIGQQRLEEIFCRNPYMEEIYPPGTRDVLEVFHLFSGSGEYFDLSCPAKIVRESFAIGEAAARTHGYSIGSACTGCGFCLPACPQSAILRAPSGKVRIDASHCLSCGRCATLCPSHAISRDTTVIAAEETNSHESDERRHSS